jgi:hypothetical protein
MICKPKRVAIGKWCSEQWHKNAKCVSFRLTVIAFSELAKQKVLRSTGKNMFILPPTLKFCYLLSLLRLLSRKSYEMQMFHMSSLKMGLDQAVLNGVEAGTSGEVRKSTFNSICLLAFNLMLFYLLQGDTFEGGN